MDYFKEINNLTEVKEFLKKNKGMSIYRSLSDIVVPPHKFLNKIFKGCEWLAYAGSTVMILLTLFSDGTFPSYMGSLASVTGFVMLVTVLAIPIKLVVEACQTSYINKRTTNGKKDKLRDFFSQKSNQRDLVEQLNKLESIQLTNVAKEKLMLGDYIGTGETLGEIQKEIHKKIDKLNSDASWDQINERVAQFEKSLGLVPNLDNKLEKSTKAKRLSYLKGVIPYLQNHPLIKLDEQQEYIIKEDKKASKQRIWIGITAIIIPLLILYTLFPFASKEFAFSIIMGSGALGLFLAIINSRSQELVEDKFIKNYASVTREYFSNPQNTLDLISHLNHIECSISMNIKKNILNKQYTLVANNLHYILDLAEGEVERQLEEAKEIEKKNTLQEFEKSLGVEYEMEFNGNHDFKKLI